MSLDIKRIDGRDAESSLQVREVIENNLSIHKVEDFRELPTTLKGRGFRSQYSY